MAFVLGDLTTVDALISRADAALYEAKRLGGDRAAWAIDEESLDPSAAATGV
jgi:PleD family two-component response regulator